jgi:poly(glycerol-phosphate) alpha-glucosyltransferase
MNYFVNENIFTLNSGTEFSAIKRLRLFEKNGVKAKILTRNYNSQLAGDRKRAHLEQEDVINMYDYFQEITDVVEHDANVRYEEIIDKYEYHIEGVDANSSLIKHNGRTIAQVMIAPATVGLIGSIEFYDDMNGVSAIDFWDRRGFKSSTQYFHPDGQPGTQIFFDNEGRPKIELIHMNINGVVHPTMYKLLDYKGKAWRFNTEHEFFVFFLNELAAKEPSVFINDRPSLTEAVAAIQEAEGKWQYLHNTHAANNDQAGASRQVVDYLKPLFNDFAGRFDGLLVATQKQADEAQKLNKFKHVLAVPDTFAEDNTLVDLAEREAGKIIFLGRLAADKGVMDAVEIFSKVHQKFSEAKLYFYGYASPADVQQKVLERAEQLGIKDSLLFPGYLAPEDLTAALKSAMVNLSVAPAEGFGMNILEAMSNGVATVAYNVKYGPSELIDNNINGVLVPRGAVQQAADAVLKLFKDKEALAEMSKAAHKKAKTFNAKESWNHWANAQVAADNLFVR